MSDQMRMNRPTWVDLSSTDAAGARTFYGKLFGWDIQVSEDPQYGGYAIATVDGGEVAGIGGQQMPGAPSVWNIYVGTPDAAALGDKVAAAGGTVIAPAFDVGDQGKIVVFQDPAGAFLSAWQPGAMTTFTSDRPNSYAWAELNSRDIDASIRFYEQVFGWTARRSEMSAGGPDYTELQEGGESIAGALPMNEMFPPEVPSYWMAYFGVTDVDAKFNEALGAGASEMVAPQDFPGGRFAIVSDPQGAVFGLLRMREG